MIYAHILENKLRMVDRFSGVRCRKLVEQDEFYGYRLEGLVKGRNKLPVSAGLLIRRGCIVGYGFISDGDLNKKMYDEEKFLCDIEQVLNELVLFLSEEETIGCPTWNKIMYQEKCYAYVTCYDDVCNEKTKNRICSIKPVLVDLGFVSVFLTALFGYTHGVYVLALVKDLGRSCRPVFEAIFTEASEGNEMFLRIKNSKFKSKKGNVIYSLDQSDFMNKFQRVTGKEFSLERRKECSY